MEFSLLGIDFIPADEQYGIWLFGIKINDFNRHFFMVHLDQGYFRLELFWINILGGW